MPACLPSYTPTPPTLIQHREHKAALDLARLYMAGNSTRPPAAPAEDDEGSARVTELTPQEARRAKAKAKLQARQQAEAAAAVFEETDPAMAGHRFGGGGT